MIAHAVHLNCSDTSHRIPQTATYSFKACLLKFVKIVRVKEIIKFSQEWRWLWTELYLFQVWVSFLRLQHSIFSKIAHYFANSLDSQGSNSEWWLTKTQPVFRISTRRPSELLNLRSSRTKNSLLKNNLSRMRNLLRIWIWFLWREDVWHKAKSFTPCHHEVAVVGWEHCLFH